MSDWPLELLGAHSDVRARIGWRGLSSNEYTDDGPYLIAGKHVVNNKIDWQSCDHVSQWRYEESPEIALRVGDVVVSKDGTIGRVARIDTLPGPATLNGTMMLVRPHPKDLDHRFLAHSLGGQAFQKLIADRVSGSSIPHLFQRDLVRLKLRMPPLEEQRRIAEILDTIDEVIRATEHIIAKLDATATALNLASFSEADTGELVRLGDTCRLLGGKRLPAGHSYSSKQTEYRYLRVVDFYKRSVDYEGLAALSASTFEALRRYEIRSGELFISIAGSIGYVGVNRPPTGMRTILTENAARIVPSDSFVPAFLALQMNSPVVSDQVRAEIGTGGGVPKLALHRVANLRVSCPSPRVQEGVTRLHEAGRAARDSESTRLDKLRQLRSGLAADLLSGRVRSVVA